MVSHPHTRRARRAAIALTALGLSALPALLGPGCSRRADIVDEPDTGVGVLTGDKDVEIPMMDAELASDAFALCEDRVLESCVGPNDFQCGLSTWIGEVAYDCQVLTGCKTNGWLKVRLDGAGCVADIGMDRPNPEIVACLLDALGAERCPCANVEATVYFGEGHDGTCPDGGVKG